MGIGQINVGVVAKTQTATKNLRDFRKELVGVGDDYRTTAKEFSGNSIAASAARFGPNAKQVKQQVQASIGELNTFRSAVVDLSQETSRYEGIGAALERETGLIGRWKGMLKQGGDAAKLFHKSVGAIAVALGATKVAFDVYQKGLKQSWADWGTWLGRQIGIIEEAGQRPDEILGRQLDEKRQALEAQKKAIEDDYKGQLAAARRRERVAMVGEDRVELEENTKKFGAARAEAIQQAKIAAENMEEARKRQEQAEEARAAAAKKREEDLARSREAAWKKEQERKKKEAETLEELRERARNFGRDQLDVERDKTLAGLRDPKQRAEAAGLFGVFKRQEAAQQQADLARQGRTFSAVDANSAAGHAQRVRILAAGRGEKTAEKQLAEAKLARQTLERIEKKGGLDLGPSTAGG